jgi:hypothetical protein
MTKSRRFLLHPRQFVELYFTPRLIQIRWATESVEKVALASFSRLAKLEYR